MLPSPATHTKPEVYDRSGTPSHENVDGLLFSAGRRSQSAEMNEMQQYIHRRIDTLGGTIFADGDVTEGGDPVILTDVEGANIRVHKGKIFLKGKVYNFENSQFLIPLDEKVSMGVRLYTDVVDHTDDIGLLNPAVRRRGYGEPGAYRVKSWIEWGWKSESGSDDGGAGDFFPVFSIDNGVIIQENSSPMAELVYKALRRYDYDGNGSYVSGGLRIRYISEGDNDYAFQLEAGAAHILGDIVERKADARLSFTKDPDELTATNEFHLFTPDVNGKMNVVLSRPPISEILTIIGTKQKTVTVTRGQTTGGKDIVDPTIASIVSLLEVKRGGTTYVANTDFVRDGDEISWAPGGVEPSPGETYTIKFNYIDSVGEPEQIFADYIVVSGYVDGQQLLITYKYKLPRIDLLVLQHDGTVNRIKGTPALANPGTPQAGPNEIALATVEYDWFSPPIIRNVAVRAVHMSDLEDMRSNIFELFRITAQEKLRNDANQKDPSSKLGVFVDSFKDDSQRDNGLSQTAAIVDGFLCLPIAATGMALDGVAAGSNQTLNYSPVVEIEQKFATQCGLINPFNVFAPPDATLILNPNADSWVIFVSQYTSQLTALLVRSGLVTRLDAIDARRERRLKQLQAGQSGVEVVSQSDIADEVSETTSKGVAIRQREIGVTIRGFQPQEQVSEAYFDSLEVESLIGLTANDDGVITGAFTIPPNVPTGTKVVYVIGEYGSYGEAYYSASFQVVPDPPPPRRHDPVAQTFTPRNDMMIAGIDVKFCKKGPTMAPVMVQIRDVVNGYPGQKVLAEKRVEVGEMTILNALTSSTGIAAYGSMRSDYPTYNNPWEGYGLVIGYAYGAWAYHSVSKFNLPANIAGATIFSARLMMREDYGSGQMNVKVHRAKDAWNQEQVTWNLRQTGTAWTAPGGTFHTASDDPITKVQDKHKAFVTWDVRSIVQQWANGQPNNGFLFRSSDENNPAAGAKYTYLAKNVGSLEIVYKAAGGGILGEGWTRVLFPLPSYLRGGTEYAATLLTTDPGHSVSFARLGDMMTAENNNGTTGFISQQAYVDGVMFESANNSAWNPRQKDDLTFRVLRCQFDNTERVVDLGKVTAGPTTDIMVRGLIQRCTGDTQVTFDVTPPNGALTVNVENVETLPLSARVSGDFGIKARLKGTNRLSPILYAQPVIVTGNLSDSGTYFTKKIKAAATFNATVIFKAFLPSGANIQVAIANATYASGNRVVTDGVHQFTWAAMTLDRSEAADEGYVEQIWKFTGAKGVTLDNLSQIRLTMNGGPSARLLVKDFQFFTK